VLCGSQPGIDDPLCKTTSRRETDLDGDGRVRGESDFELSHVQTTKDAVVAARRSSARSGSMRFHQWRPKRQTDDVQATRRRNTHRCRRVVNGGQNPTPDDGVDQKCETIPILQNCSVLVVDVIDGRYRVRRKEPEGRVQTHPARLVSGRGDAGVWMR